ncbi:MAG TPA: c-type cytochrome [Thermoleophilaceae bacterium]|nr:c-type cytochrome [Thermoleophilaceae bacterium]
MRRRSTLLLALVAVLAAGCGAATKPEVVPGASVSQGHDLIAHYGCGACHQIGGVAGADGHVGPPLKNFKKNIPFIVGKLPNTPANAARWIQNPQAILPQGIMPNLGVTPQQARDIAAYLYTQ